jgi:hypothetical protein
MKKLLLVLLSVSMLVMSGCPNVFFPDDDGDLFDTLLQDTEFLPNSKGQIGPFEPFELTDGLYGMLLIDTVERNNNAFTEGTYFEVDMSFIPPATIGATSYTLEYSSDNAVFQPYKHDGVEDLVTPSSDTDNFSIAPGGSYYFRLAINGGPYDGWHSNSVHAPYTNIDTYWGGYSLNADMTNSDPPVMVPYIGNARVISMTANNLDDHSQVAYTPLYQWYRLNPATYELTEVYGATQTLYTTTAADAGYSLVVVGMGDEVNVGGFQQVLDDWGVKIPNRSFALDADFDGFYLVLEHAVVGLAKEDFTLYEDDWTTEIPITNLTAVEGHPGIYRVDASIPPTVEAVYLACTSAFWTLTSHLMEDHPWGENLMIDFP